MIETLLAIVVLFFLVVVLLAATLMGLLNTRQKNKRDRYEIDKDFNKPNKPKP